jgi:light-harvesting protein B-800-850 alpha chain
MNQGRVWCVVHPTVGLPLLLGSVAVTALIVHACLLTHTTWFGNYWMGAKARTAALDTVSPQTASAAPAGFAMTVTPAAGSNGAAPASFVITVTPSPAAAAAAKVVPASESTSAHKPAALPLKTASAN